MGELAHAVVKRESRLNRIHRAWQWLPRDWRRRVLFGVMELAAPRIARPVPAPAHPVIHAGYFHALSGLGMAARRLQAGLAAAGLEPVLADLTGPLRQGPPAARPHVVAGPGTILVHVNGPMLPWALAVLGRRALAGKRVIAVWNWELPVLPADWQPGFAHCHEIWASSHFTADTFIRSGTVPVRVVPYPVTPTPPSPLGRADFGLPEDAFVMLQIFDAASSIARKNPTSSIAAHRLAFGDDPRRILVLKVHNTERAGDAWRYLAAMAAERPNVVVLNRTLTDADLSALILCCDLLVSLHRAEGFGFTLAEALALGRPVIATDWSGNTDFMQASGAHRVPFSLCPAQDDQATYNLPGAQWAEPDTVAAAALMQSISGNAAARQPTPHAFPAPDYRTLLGLRET